MSASAASRWRDSPKGLGYPQQAGIGSVLPAEAHILRQRQHAPVRGRYLPPHLAQSTRLGVVEEDGQELVAEAWS